ncbi:MAG: bifunctional 5,10-methylenetetrahydrofolate dehydrogenase/5,10-methenyltetrahydrofolate cyclohydrolase [candidate division WOR-3 bacterium]|nr:MAG: bifunctional 5,10-methylenetetrahydrofolate dehydrogenase/5,10-methenyltetrahydrofolate cyclohydrolase [candidate division WOR-3 bacterium]
MNSASVIDGKLVARQVRRELRTRVAALKAAGTVPKLGIVLVGDFAPSEIYVRSKERAGARVGIEVQTARLGTKTSFEELSGRIRTWNSDETIHGIIVQMPLPGHLDESAALALVSPDKDVDGLTPTNLGRLMAGEPAFLPATPAGIVELLARGGFETAGRHVVIVGRSRLVGKPLANLLLLKGDRGDATVTVCHSRTPNLAEVCLGADILVVAAGRAGLVTSDMVRQGAVVVDVGTNRTEHGLVGDVDFAAVSTRASAITPVPGGVGPMTVAMLLANTVKAAEAAPRE